ncbi:saxitoxin and tetrodotoxin-binding protein 1-like [Myripristis murdjan]|uniref:saxitoxin and tetrodotoxin-binding protein 1-like n=1 Tax=Myripristis murdjan TaxID=586833 RepID=UPI0011762D7F|nr:saxitoxin and tetrodotoxin-binding protein 1-like [Myripristis murdjan]
MVVLQLASVLISLLCFSAAAPPMEDCSQLNKSLTMDELDKILGRWIFIQGLANHETSTIVKTMTLKTSANNDTLLMVQEIQYEENAMCIPVPMNFTLSGSTIQLKRGDSSNTAYFLQSCTDCLVMYTLDSGFGKKYEFLNIYGRTGNLTESDLDHTRKQAECLGFEPLHMFNSEPGSCPTPQNQTSHVKEE